MEIIPFGKYKDQPIEALQHDKQYIEWLITQDWFKQRYPTLNTIIINNFGQPAETPEHNRLQAMFTDDDFLIRIAEYIIKVNNKIFSESDYSKFSNRYEVKFKAKNNNGFIIGAEFERDGVDVKLYIQKHLHDDVYLTRQLHEQAVNIELKQTIGDDYPAVLRQMHANNSIILFAEKFNATTVTLDQIRKMFGDKIIILLSDI